MNVQLQEEHVETIYAAEGKSHCVIIDLIDNYRNADVKLSLLDGIHLDTRVVNLLQELSRKRVPRREKLHQDFLGVKRELGRLPTYIKGQEHCVIAD
ncbi:hypothetical protein MHI01_13570 [Paenibacillus sp. FSL M7-0656]|uniref:hypothetical protein n=1 Tax=Paenibacillus sp. FSL M7-0656 TaxID=2921534 RepID=UPI0030F68813